MNVIIGNVAGIFERVFSSEISVLDYNIVSASQFSSLSSIIVIAGQPRKEHCITKTLNIPESALYATSLIERNRERRKAGGERGRESAASFPSFLFFPKRPCNTRTLRIRTQFNSHVCCVCVCNTLFSFFPVSPFVGPFFFNGSLV